MSRSARGVTSKRSVGQKRDEIHHPPFASVNMLKELTGLISIASSLESRFLPNPAQTIANPSNPEPKRGGEAGSNNLEGHNKLTGDQRRVRNRNGHDGLRPSDGRPMSACPKPKLIRSQAG